MEIRQYNNPIIRGFNPDPSICREGDDYYLAVSSFEYFPGLPIYHSRDLVNWEQIANAVNFGSSLTLDGANESGGIWAPTIRYHDGMYFITAAMETHRINSFGNFIIHAEKPEGPWSDPVWVPIGGIDPSIMFEGGKAWYCTNDSSGMYRETIKLGAVDPFTGEVVEKFRAIWHGEGGGWTEAPHVYHIGEWYYCMCAEGGTGPGHNIVIARSKDIYGPYESCPYNPILTNRNDTDKQASCCGHGDLFSDSCGNWWMVLLGHRSAVLNLSSLGRETYLVPVKWENGWPVIRDGRVHAVEEGPLAEEQRPWEGFYDDFSDEKWKLGWQFIRCPEPENYRRGDKRLVITPSNAAPSSNDGGSFVCIKQPDLEFELTVELAYAPRAEGESAGVMLYLTHLFRYVFGIRRKNGRRELFLQRFLDDVTVDDYVRELAANEETEPLKLCVRGTKESFAFSAVDKNGKADDPKAVSARFLSNGIVGRGFTGTMVGLFAYSPEEHGTEAAFAEFAVK